MRKKFYIMGAILMICTMVSCQNMEPDAKPVYDNSAEIVDRYSEDSELEQNLQYLVNFRFL